MNKTVIVKMRFVMVVAIAMVTAVVMKIATVALMSTVTSNVNSDNNRFVNGSASY